MSHTATVADCNKMMRERMASWLGTSQNSVAVHLRALSVHMYIDRSVHMLVDRSVHMHCDRSVHMHTKRSPSAANLEASG